MIKYLRDKITGRSTVFSSSDDLLIEENMPSMIKTQSQNSLNDVMSISTNSNSNDITSIDRTTSQVEKLLAGGSSGINSGQRSIYSSTPIIIPKKPTRSNASSQSSSSYTSVADQMSLLGETSLRSHRDIDDASHTSLPILSANCQHLEHSAARDRIAVKNKRRQQPIKQKLGTLRETDDNKIDLFSSNEEEEEEEVINEVKAQPQQQQPIVNLSDLDAARTRLRVANRPRDHSADNALIVPTYISSVQRSTSFKRPQEINETKFMNRSIYEIKKYEEDDDDDEEEENKNESKSSVSSQEHIYDNLDLYKRHKTNLSNENQSLISTPVIKRDYSTSITNRLRPVTMHIPTNNDKQFNNEFENAFNHLKKVGAIKKIQPKEEIKSISPPQEPVQTLPSAVSIEEKSPSLFIESEQIVPVVSPTNKIIEIQTPNRRRTLGGAHIPGNNKVATEDNKPTPSWIDIAKQKQNKFHSSSIDKDHQEEPEQQSPCIEPTVVVVPRRQVNISYNVTTVNENTSEDNRMNRKSMFESAISRRATPPRAPTNTHVIERDSIRALKAGNPNRINSLIQLFDK